MPRNKAFNFRRRGSGFKKGNKMQSSVINTSKSASDCTDKLFYYSKSKDMLPGNGRNESVNNVDEYHELVQIVNWRKILSNFHESPFQYNNKQWNTIEHAFQSHKISLVDKEIAEKFECGGEFDGAGINARKKRKVVILSDDLLLYWNSVSNEVMQSIMTEKYKQCRIYCQVLKLTKSAELWHIIERGRPQRQYYLESLRLT